MANPDRHKKSVGVNYLSTAEQLCLDGPSEDAGPYNEKSNFLMRRSLCGVVFIRLDL